MALSALAFSVMALLVKEAGQRLPSSEIVLVRAAVTLVFSWVLLRHARLSWRGNRRDLLLLRGVLGFVALTAFYYAVVHLPLADATVIQYTNPVFAAVIAAAALGERLRGREVALILASLGGVVLAARPAFLFGGAALPMIPVAVGLTGALFSAAAYVTVRKLGESDDTLVIVFYFSGVATVGAIPLAAGSALWPTPREWLVLVGVGVATQLGQVFMTIGLRKEKAGRATAASYLAVAFSAAWGFLFYGEIPSVWLATGALVIVAATVTLSRIRASPPVPLGSRAG
jgi:drug/metabolite transporter (DMT)-like permease